MSTRLCLLLLHSIDLHLQKQLHAATGCVSKLTVNKTDAEERFFLWWPFIYFIFQLLLENFCACGILMGIMISLLLFDAHRRQTFLGGVPSMSYLYAIHVESWWIRKSRVFLLSDKDKDGNGYRCWKNYLVKWIVRNGNNSKEEIELEMKGQ